MRRFVAVTAAGLVVVSAFALFGRPRDCCGLDSQPSQSAARVELDRGPAQPPRQRWSGWVFGRMCGVPVPGLGPQPAAAPEAFAWQ